MANKELLSRIHEQMANKRRMEKDFKKCIKEGVCSLTTEEERHKVVFSNFDIK